MAVLWSSPELASRFRPHIAELRRFFDRQGLHYGAAEDIIPLVERLGTSGPFADELSSLVRSIIVREGGNMARADLLEMVAVAIGGPRIDEAAQEFQQPVRQLYSFLTAVVRKPIAEPPTDRPAQRLPERPPEFSTEPVAPAVEARAPSEETTATREEPAAPPVPSSSRVIADLLLQDMVFSRVHRDQAAPETPPAAPLAAQPIAPPVAQPAAPAAAFAPDPSPQPSPQPPFEAAALPTREPIFDAAVRSPEPMLDEAGDDALTPEPTRVDAEEETEYAAEDDAPTPQPAFGPKIYVMPKPAHEVAPEAVRSFAADFALEPLIDFLREAEPEPTPALAAAPPADFSQVPVPEPAASAPPQPAATVPLQPFVATLPPADTAPSPPAAATPPPAAIVAVPTQAPAMRNWLIAGTGATLLAAALVFAFGLRVYRPAPDQSPPAAAPATPAAAIPEAPADEPVASTDDAAGSPPAVASPASTAASPSRPSPNDSAASAGQRSERVSRSTEIIAKPYSKPIPSQRAAASPASQTASDGVAYPTVHTIDPSPPSQQTPGRSAPGTPATAPIVRVANSDATYVGDTPAASSRVSLEPYKDSPGGRVGIANTVVDAAPGTFSGRYPTVSSGVMAGNLLSAPLPNYPTMARIARVQGQVVMEAVVSTSGTVSATHVLSGPRLLRGAAVDAVRRWRYKPYLVNGSPVDVATIVTVDFNSSDQ